MVREKGRAPRAWIAALMLVFLNAPVHAHAEKIWTAELFGGSAYNFRTPLRIEQAGEPEIEINARYKTRAFDNAPYYVLRIGRWEGTQAWEGEHIHHKIYLSNNPPEVGHFQIEHGYNLFMLNRAWMRSGWVYRMGAGIAVTRPLSVIRDRRSLPDDSVFFDGYRITGGGLQAAGEKRFYLSEGFFVALEGKLTAAWVRVRINGGRASAPNVALHGLVGFGADF